MVAPGPFNHAVNGALVRNVWAGVGAWIGLRSVDWAGFCIRGAASSPYEVFVGGLGAECRSARGGPDRPFAPSEIREKLRGITAPVYPRMPDTCRDLAALDGDLLETTRTDAVARMPAGPPS